MTAAAAVTITPMRTRNLATFDPGTMSNESLLMDASKLAWKIATKRTLRAVHAYSHTIRTRAKNKEMNSKARKTGAVRRGWVPKPSSTKKSGRCQTAQGSATIAQSLSGL